MGFNDALIDFRDGRLKMARTKLSKLEDRRSKLLFLRVQGRLGETRGSDVAISQARELWTSSLVDLRDRVEAGILLSFLLARTGLMVEAESCIQKTKQFIGQASIGPDLESELWHADAVVLFAQRRYAESERAAWNAIYADLELGHRTSENGSTVVAIQTTKARAFQVLSLIRGTQERFHEQYRFLREAMTLLRTAPYADRYLTSVLQANRSFYARDLGMLSEIIELQLLPHDHGADDLAEFRVEITRSLGYLYALDGHDDRAIASFHDASTFTGSEANRLLLISDAAYISRQAVVPRLLKAELMDACQIADSIDWKSIDVERYALHAFAQELALVNPQRALGYMDQYLEPESESNPLVISDRRADAEAKYSVGVVAFANGQRDRGLDAFVSAYETWVSVGFRWRAAAAAIELADLPGHSAFASYAARESRQYPNSWLGRRALRYVDLVS